MGHCAPGAAMHPEIVEAGEKLIRRYVVNAPHSRAKWVGGENGRNRPSHWLLSGQVFGRGRYNAIPPEYWIAGRRSAVAGRRPSVVVPWFCCAQPILRGSDRACGEGDSVAYSASSGGVGWVERSKTHRMSQRRRGAGWQQWGCGMNTDDSRIIARFQR